MKGDWLRTEDLTNKHIERESQKGEGAGKNRDRRKSRTRGNTTKEDEEKLKRRILLPPLTVSPVAERRRGRVSQGEKDKLRSIAKA